MKRKIICVLCLLLATALLAAPILAAKTVSLSLDASDKTANREDSVTVSVSATVDQCKSGSIQISYDSSVFEFVSGEWVVENPIMQAVSTTNNNGVFALSEATALSGTVFAFVLKVKEGAALGNSSVSVTFTADNAVSDSASVSITIACAHRYTDACDPTCDLCGAAREVSHSWDDGTVTEEPTCTAEGVKTYTCKVCGKTKTESVGTTDHDYDSGEVTKEPTCTEEGEKTLTCKACGKTKTQAVDPTGHNYDSGVVTQEPTCTEDGVRTRTCENCGKTKTSSIECKGHSYDDGVVSQEPTCTEKGKVIYTCGVCGKEKKETLDPLDHQYDTECDTDCNRCGTLREVNHDFVPAGDDQMHWQECELCGAVENKETHTVGETMRYDDAEHGYLCTVCGLVAQPEAHVYDHECDPTCDVCGYTRGITHYYSSRWTYDANGHWYECTVCGDQLEMELHVPGEEATETTDQFCIICGYIIQPAGNHQHTMDGDWLCDETGHWFQCGCLEFTDPAPHVWDAGVIDEENLLILYTCTDCGYSMTEAYTPPTEPQPTDPTETVPPATSGQPTDPTGSTEDPSWLDFDFNLSLGNFKLELWMILAACLAVSVGLNVFFLVCLFSKRKTGKFSKREKLPNEGDPLQETEE